MTQTLEERHKPWCKTLTGHYCTCWASEPKREQEVHETETKKLVLKIFHKGDCPICNLDDVSRFIRDTVDRASIYQMDVQTYNIDTADGIAEAALERIATSDMPIMMVREG